jgi:hypothetical protein
MASIFCPSCGSKSEYKFATPNFCFKCGSAYSGSSNFTQSSKIFKQTSSKQSIEDDDTYEDEDSDENFEDFSNSTRVPRISKLQVEIDSDTDVRVIKFEDFLNGNLNSKFKRPKNLDIGNI